MRWRSVVIIDPIHAACTVVHPYRVCILMSNTPNDFSIPPIKAVIINAPIKYHQRTYISIYFPCTARDCSRAQSKPKKCGLWTCLAQHQSLYFMGGLSLGESKL